MSHNLFFYQSGRLFLVLFLLLQSVFSISTSFAKDRDLSPFKFRNEGESLVIYGFEGDVEIDKKCTQEAGRYILKISGKWKVSKYLNLPIQRISRKKLPCTPDVVQFKVNSGGAEERFTVKSFAD